MFFNLALFSQVGGQSVYQFLNLNTSPRQAALGGKIVTLYDEDVNQAHFNPATINGDMNGQLALNYGSYYGEISYGTLSYARNFGERNQTYFGGVNYVNYGTIEGYDEDGQKTNDFTGSEASLAVGTAYVIPNSKFIVGTNAKLISSSLESYYSLGIALDIGVSYVNKEKRINWGVAFRNIGAEIKPYYETREKLPFEITAGFSQRLEHVPIRYHITIENLQQWQLAFSNPNRAQVSLDGTVTEEKVSFFNNMMRHTIIGAELFPENGFNLRIGYNFRRGEELKILEQRHFSGLSFGVGLKINKLKFNYSYSRYTLAANTGLFGLTIDFSGDKN